MSDGSSVTPEVLTQDGAIISSGPVLIQYRGLRMAGYRFT